MIPHMMSELKLVQSCALQNCNKGVPVVLDGPVVRVVTELIVWMVPSRRSSMVWRENFTGYISIDGLLPDLG